MPFPLNQRSMMLILVAAVVISAVIFIGTKTGRTDTSTGNDDDAGALNETARGANLTYLDDTESDPGVFTVLISQDTDFGILVVGSKLENGTDTVNLAVQNTSQGVSVDLETDRVTIEAGDMEPVLVTYHVNGASQDAFVIINATAESDPNNPVNITLRLDIVSGNPVTGRGDQLMVEYRLTDPQGNELDAGTLPAQAGVPEAGPAGQVGYIEGFYLGLMGMEKPGGFFGIASRGETKTIRVPPPLGYGTANGHELEDTTLIFTLTLVAKGPLA